MKNNYILSIIVPIYNRNYNLEKCLNLLADQSLQNYEVILVDDGSDNDTANFLDCFVKKNKCFQVIHSVNKGVWSARKLGLHYAKGKWIGFCDSDDFIHKDMYEKMVLTGEQSDSDIVVGGYRRVNDTTGKTISEEMTGWKHRYMDAQEHIGELCLINTALWNKIYLADLLKNVISLDFPPKIAEDMMFLLSIYPHVNRVAFVSEVLYDYNVHSASAMQNITQKDCEDTIKAMNIVSEKIKKSDISEDWKNLCDVMAFIHLGISLPVAIYGTKDNWTKNMMQIIKKELKRNYITWENASILKHSYILRHNCKLYKLKFMQIIYKLGLFGFFLKLYTGITKLMGKSIKW